MQLRLAMSSNHLTRYEKCILRQEVAKIMVYGRLQGPSRVTPNIAMPLLPEQKKSSVMSIGLHPGLLVQPMPEAPRQPVPAEDPLGMDRNSRVWRPWSTE